MPIIALNKYTPGELSGAFCKRKKDHPLKMGYQYEDIRSILSDIDVWAIESPYTKLEIEGFRLLKNLVVLFEFQEMDLEEPFSTEYNWEYLFPNKTEKSFFFTMRAG